MLKATLKYNVGSKAKKAAYGKCTATSTATATATARDMRLIEKRAAKLSGQGHSKRQAQ